MSIKPCLHLAISLSGLATGDAILLVWQALGFFYLCGAEFLPWNMSRNLLKIVPVILSGHVRISSRESQLHRRRSGKSALSQRQQSEECRVQSPIWSCHRQPGPALLLAARLWWVVVFSKARLGSACTELTRYWADFEALIVSVFLMTCEHNRVLKVTQRQL